MWRWWGMRRRRMWGMRRVMKKTIRIGVGYRRELADWLAKAPHGITCMELTAEHFYGNSGARSDFGRCQKRVTAEECRYYVHGLGMSLGTPGRLDQQRLEDFAKVANYVNAD